MCFCFEFYKTQKTKKSLIVISALNQTEKDSILCVEAFTNQTKEYDFTFDAFENVISIQCVISQSTNIQFKIC